ncbi:hypothetical protein HaLaN_32827, partial [Haematococcus lacustris]
MYSMMVQPKWTRSARLRMKMMTGRCWAQSGPMTGQ